LILAIFAKKSPRYILPTAAAVASTLGTMGWIGEPLNFFHSLCLFVFTGLGLDYTIFHLSNRSRTLRKTVLFSFLTSLTGLGMLAFTSFSVTRSMGLTLALGLSFAYFYSLSGGNAETPRGSGQWFEQKEQSAGKIRIWILWYLYSLAGKGLVKAICIPVIACIYPFAAPAKCALGKFRRKIRLIAKERGLPEPEMPSLFGHLLGFAWSMVDKTDACTLAKNPPVMEFRDDDSKKFLELVESKKGAMVVSSHVGTIEVLPCAKSSTANCPHVHAFKQLGHNSIFTEMLSSKLDTSNLTVHPTEEIGVETAVRMKENIDKGDLVIMAGDRLSAGNSNASLTRTFLGEKCKFPKGVFVFAKLMEAPVFFVTCVRTGWNKYEIHVKEHSGELQPGKILDGFAEFLEKETLAHPGEWFHFHDFFMTDRD
jgi:predicted LPLAT superfamily acyltransferase